MLYIVAIEIGVSLGLAHYGLAVALIVLLAINAGGKTLIESATLALKAPAMKGEVGTTLMVGFIGAVAVHWVCFVSLLVLIAFAPFLIFFS